MLYFFIGDESLKCTLVIPTPPFLATSGLLIVKKSKIIPIHYPVTYVTCRVDSCLMN